jgi:hypothetical protein
VLADTEYGSKQKNDEDTKRDPSVLHVLLFEKQVTSHNHANHWCGEHEKNASPFDTHRDFAMNKDPGNQARKHDKETAERARPQYEGHNSVEGWFSELAHNCPFNR